ncbi:HutD family protein [Streptomyces sp. ISL-10]|nr:HutD family protein [Streptomyces sp. ISL-10]MBT2366620.1 HutD family protein [Streptomyces sp. ISL-10]
MTMRLLRAAGRVAVPWKNGGGVTREIAASPEGAPMDAFDWRISLAEVADDGPFSAFPAVDRTLTVVEGRGMELTVGGERLVVDERFVPRDFPGDRATEGRLLGGPVVNFNVMHNRDRAVVMTSVVRGRLPVVVPDRSVVVAVALRGTTVLEAMSPGAGRVTLERYDAAVLDGHAVVLATDGDAALVTIRLREA